MRTPDRIGCHPSAVCGATVGINVGEGCGVGGCVVGVGVIVGSGVRVGSSGAASVGKGDEAALAGTHAASIRQLIKNRMPDAGYERHLVSRIVHPRFFGFAALRSRPVRKAGTHPVAGLLVFIEHQHGASILALLDLVEVL